MKKLTTKGWNAYKRMRELNRQIGQLKKEAEKCKEEFELALGRANAVQAPGQLVIYRELIANPGYTVAPFVYSVYREGVK